MPKVSVIVPIYNTGDYLRPCLDSLVGQSLHDIEIICVNDASTDTCITILNEYAQKDPRVKILHHEQNKGAAVARNFGLSVATGEYIGFVDSDDYVSLNYFEKLYAAAKQSKADIAKANFFSEDIVCRKHNEIKNLDIEKNKFVFCINFTTAIYKLDIIKNNSICFPNEITNYEDVVFLVKCVYYSNKVITVDSVYYYYVERPGSSSRGGDREKIFSSVLDSCLQIVKFINGIDIKESDYILIFKSCFNDLIWLKGRMTAISEECSKKELTFLKNYKLFNGKQRLNDIFPAHKSFKELLCRKDQLFELAKKSGLSDHQLLCMQYRFSLSLNVCIFWGGSSAEAVGELERVATIAHKLSEAGLAVILLHAAIKTTYHFFQRHLADSAVITLPFLSPSYISKGREAIQRNSDLFLSIRSWPLPPFSLLSLSGILEMLSPDIIHCFQQNYNLLCYTGALLTNIPHVILADLDKSSSFEKNKNLEKNCLLTTKNLNLCVNYLKLYNDCI